MLQRINRAQFAPFEPHCTFQTNQWPKKKKNHKSRIKREEEIEEKREREEETKEEGSIV